MILNLFVKLSKIYHRFKAKCNYIFLEQLCINNIVRDSIILRFVTIEKKKFGREELFVNSKDSLKKIIKNYLDKLRSLEV